MKDAKTQQIENNISIGLTIKGLISLMEKTPLQINGKGNGFVVLKGGRYI